MVCHTIAHAPHPLTASQMPTTAPAARPMALLMATGRTFISFMKRLVWTMAAALRMKLRNMTRLRGIRRWSFSKHWAMSGAHTHRIA